MVRVLTENMESLCISRQDDNEAEDDDEEGGCDDKEEDDESPCHHTQRQEQRTTRTVRTRMYHQMNLRPHDDNEQRPARRRRLLGNS